MMAEDSWLTGATFGVESMLSTSCMRRVNHFHTTSAEQRAITASSSLPSGSIAQPPIDRAHKDIVTHHESDLSQQLFMSAVLKPVERHHASDLVD